MKKYPCKGCTSRTVGCHATCEAYKAAKASWDAERAVAREEHRKGKEFCEVVAESMKRNRCKRYDRSR